MAWTQTKQDVSERGIQFEFRGSEVDQQGRPTKCASVFVPFDKPAPEQPPVVDPAVFAAARATAATYLRDAVGDGTLDPKRSLVARMGQRAPARKTVAKHTAVASAGAGALQLLLAVL